MNRSGEYVFSTGEKATQTAVYLAAQMVIRGATIEFLHYWAMHHREAGRYKIADGWAMTALCYVWPKKDKDGVA